MSRNRFFLVDTYYNIKDKLPPYVFKAIIRLAPIYLVTSLFEIFGLFVLFPVIRIIIEPAIIQENKYVNLLYTSLHFKNNISFVLFLFSSITILFVLKNFFFYIISKNKLQ